MLLSWIFCLSLSWALPEAELLARLPEVREHFASGEFKGFTSRHGERLEYYQLRHPQAQRVIILLPGRSEPIQKYAELAFDLRGLMAHIYVLSHRGQGGSQRLLKDPQKGHVRDFRHYVDDFSDWLDQVVVPATGELERVLVAHSMGAGVATFFMAERPSFFRRAVLSAPMFEIETAPYSERTARYLSRALVSIGRGAHYAPGRGPYDAAADTFDANEVTHSPVRFELMKSIWLERPDLIVAGATSRWVHTWLEGLRSIVAKAPLIETPVLMFQAGQDTYVRPGRQNSFCERHRACTSMEFADAYHEILMERDEEREVALRALTHFVTR